MGGDVGWAKRLGQVYRDPERGKTRSGKSRFFQILPHPGITAKIEPQSLGMKPCFFYNGDLLLKWVEEIKSDKPPLLLDDSANAGKSPTELFFMKEHQGGIGNNQIVGFPGAQVEHLHLLKTDAFEIGIPFALFNHRGDDVAPRQFHVWENMLQMPEEITGGAADVQEARLSSVGESIFDGLSNQLDEDLVALAHLLGVFLLVSAVLLLMIAITHGRAVGGLLSHRGVSFPLRASILTLLHFSIDLNRILSTGF